MATYEGKVPEATIDVNMETNTITVVIKAPSDLWESDKNMLVEVFRSQVSQAATHYIRESFSGLHSSSS